MSTTMTYDIIIVGGGVNGLTMAATLVETGLSVAIVESESLYWNNDNSTSKNSVQLEPFDFKVYALTVASKHFLQSLGIWQEIPPEKVSTYKHMYVWDSEGISNIHFTAEDADLSELGYIVEHRILHQKLLKHLKNTGTTIIENQKITKLKQNNDKVTLFGENNLQLSAQLVIAADGKNSSIRHLAGIPTREWDYWHHAIVTCVQTEKHHQDTAWQVFTPFGPLAFLPLASNDPNTHYCSIVWSQTPDRAKQLMSYPKSYFAAELEKAFEFKLGKITAPFKRYRIPLSQQHAQQYFKNRVVLIGDAAHNIHPLAGLGINLGLLDTKSLSYEIHNKLLHNKRFAVTNQMLTNYKISREPHNLAAMAAMQIFQHLFSSKNIFTKWIKNIGMNKCNHTHLFKKHLIKYITNNNSS